MPTNKDELEPIEPNRARELFIDQKSTQCVESTVKSYRYRLQHFIEWCDENDITNLNVLTGRDLQEYRLWRRENGDLNKISLNQQMCSIRVFLKWCGSIEAVAANLYDKVMVPRVSPDEERNEETLDAETAQEILEYLTTYKYASREHALFALLWETGIRIGAAHSLDVADLDVDGERIELLHRPERGTRLKNGASGERPVAISTELATMLHNYRSDIRPDVTDDCGRDPLLTTEYGRMTRTSMRRTIYRITAPCFRDEPCPDCTETNQRKCPEAVCPHAIRRGSITHFLSEDVPVEVVTDRMNLSRDVLEKHYDKRSEEVKLEQRREYLEKV
jgi:site-specific recombinase XerD